MENNVINNTSEDRLKEAAELERRIAKLRRSPRLGRLFKLYIDNCSGVLKGASCQRLTELWCRHMGPAEELRADRISPLIIQELVLRRIFAERKYATGVMLSYALPRLTAFAVAAGILKSDPLATLKELPLVKRMKRKADEHALHRPTFSHSRLDNELKKLAKIFKEKGSDRRQALLELSLRLLLRPGETVALRIGDLDLKEHVLRVRMTKTRDLFVIPADEKLEVLLQKSFRDFGSDTEGWVFRGIRDPKAHLSPQTLNKALKSLGYKGVLCAHGIRAIGSNWFAHHSRAVPPYVRESILQHAVSGTDTAYRHDDDYLLQRRQAMKLWWRYLDKFFDKED